MLSRSLARSLLKIVGVVLAIPLVLVLAARIFIELPPGERWLRGFVERQVDDALPGRITIERIDVLGWSRAELTGLRLLGVDGEELARLDSVRGSIDLRSLLRREIVIDSLEASGLSAELVPDDDGELPLVRALTPEEEEAKDDGGSTFDVLIRDATVGLGSITWRTQPGEKPVFVADEGVVTGGIELRGKRLTFDAEVRAQLSAPGRGEATGSFAGILDDGSLRLSEGRAVLPGGIVVDLSTDGESDATDDATSSPSTPDATTAPDRPLLDRVRVHLTLPRDGLLPYDGPLLAGPVDIDALLRFRGERIHFDATATPRGTGPITAAGWFQSGDPGTFDALVDARGVDPARLLPDLPAGEFWMAVRADGALAFPPNARANARVWIAPSSIQDARVGRGSARVSLAGDVVEMNDVALELPGASLTGSARVVGTEPERAHADVTIEKLSTLASTARAAGIDVPALDGRGTARLRLTRGGEDFRVEARLRELAIDGRPFLETSFDLRRSNELLRLDARTETKRGAVVLTARGKVESPEEVSLNALRLQTGRLRWTLDRTASVRWRGERVAVRNFGLTGPGSLRVDASAPTNAASRAPLEAEIRVSQFDLASLAPLFADEDPTGRLHLELIVGGTRRAPTLDATFAAEEVESVTIPRVSTDVDLSLSSREATTTGWVLAGGGALVRFDANVTAPQGRSLYDEQGRNAARVEARIDAPAIDLDALARAGLVPPNLGGRLQAKIEIDGTAGNPEVSAQAHLADLYVGELPFGEIPPTSATLRFDASGQEVSARLDADVHGAPPIEVHARLERSLLSLTRDDAWRTAPFRAALVMERGRIQTPQAGLVAEEAALDIRVHGTLSRPLVSLKGDADALRALDNPVGQVDVDGELGKESWRFALSLVPVLGGPLTINLTGPALGQSQKGQSRGERTPWRGVIEAEQTRLDFLELFPRLRLVEDAVLDGKLEIQEDTFAPLLAGGLHLEARRLAIAGVGTVNGLELTLRGEGHTLALDRLVMWASGGKLESSGALSVVENGWRFALNASADQFPFPTPLRPSGTATTSLSVRLAESDRAITGRVELDRGELQVSDPTPERELHPLTLPPDYEVHGRERTAQREPSILERWLSVRTARVQARIPRGFWVRSELANADVRADTTVVWDGSQVLLEGEAEVVRGTITVVRRRFDVAEFVASFGASTEINPSLRGRLTLDDRDLQVTILVGGRLRSPEVNISSEPAMSPAELALLLASGGAGGVAVGSGVAGTALSGALNYVAGQVGRALTDFLPLDVLAFELGPSGEAKQIEAGAYVTPDLFVSFVRNLFAQTNENTNEVQAEYHLGRRTSIRTRYGDRQSGGIDLLYQLRFRSKSQLKAERK